ncbi:MAG: CRTAC1 family protein [Fuerstiella sp.]
MHFRRAFFLALVASAMAGCGDSKSRTTSPQRGVSEMDGHTRMLNVLREIRDTSSEEHPYFSERDLRFAKSRLALLRAGGVDQTNRVQLNLQIGHGELQLGRTETAIDHLQSAYDVFLQHRDRLRLDAHQTEVVLLFQLAVANLRLAETENCVHCENSESCIFPIRDGGVHVHQKGARRAIELLDGLLKLDPDHLPAMWLLNIAHMTLGSFPQDVARQYRIPDARFESAETFPRFANVASNVGLDTFGLCGGSIVDDFNGDGLLDVVVSNWDTAGQIQYFRNVGDGSFSDETKAGGLTGIYGGLNLIQADYDNDDDVDIFVLRGAWLGNAGRYPNSLLQNDGHGKFRDVTFDAGLAEVNYPTQTAAWADFDNDGDLDLYVGNELFPSQLFENDGNGRFKDVAERAGVINGGVAKGVVWGDYDGDRYPDLFVSNIERENRLYHNNRDGTFTDVAPSLGMTKPTRSFPTWFWDCNNDGALDLYVASYWAGVQYVAADYLEKDHPAEPDCLYMGDGQGGFTEAAADNGLTRVTIPMGANFGDLDNDGFPDFYLGTGYTQYEGLMPNLMFRNRGGQGFANVTTAGGFGHLQKGHGVSFADLDNDGDQDIFIELGGALKGDGFANALFENQGFGNHWITVKLIGTRSNRSAIGARIRLDIVENGTNRSIFKWVNSGGSFGANPLRREIGLGNASEIETLEVFWPTTGKQQRFRNVEVDQFIEIIEGDAEYRRVARKSHSFRAAATTGPDTNR